MYIYYMALRTPTRGSLIGTYNRNIRESQRVKGLRSKLSPKEYIWWTPPSNSDNKE